MEEKAVSDQQETSPSGENDKQDVVKYETYRRVLSQHKASQSKIDELEGKLNELNEFREKVVESKNMDEGNWKALVEQRDNKISQMSEENGTLKNENHGFKKNLDDMVKINSFVGALGGKLKKTDYLRFVDTEKIVIDPETQAIDEMSLKQYANEFVNNYKELIEFNESKLPQGAAQSSQKEISEMSADELKQYMKQSISQWK